MEVSKKDMKRNTVNTVACNCCLSLDRLLRPLLRYETVFKKLMEIPNKVSISHYLICWECLSVLRKVVSFKKQVRMAQSLLQQNEKQSFLPTLSKLKICNFEPTSYMLKEDIKIIDQKEVKIEVDVKEEVLPTYELNTKIYPEVLDISYEKNIKCDDTKIDSHTHNEGRSVFGVVENEVRSFRDFDDSDINDTNNEKSHFSDDNDDDDDDDDEIKMNNVDDTEANSKNRKTRKSLKGNPLNNTDANSKNRKPRKSLKGIPLNDTEANSKNHKPRKSLKVIPLNDTEENSKNLKPRKSLKGIPLNVPYRMSVNMDVNIKKTPTDIENWNIQMQNDINSEWFKEIKFKCTKCHMVLQSLVKLIKHTDTYHRKGQKYICDVCTCGFEEKSSLFIHIQCHKYLYECMVCQFKTCFNVVIKKHFEKNHSREFECTKCEMSFKRRVDFYEHYNAAHRKFICDYCAKEHTTKNAVKGHIMRHHVPHACKACPKTFNKYRFYLDHVRRYHGASEMRYCVECDMHYSDTKTYRRHLLTAARHRPANMARPLVPCPQCDRQYTRRSFMMNHFRHVHLNSGHPCDSCDKRFLTRSRLVTHKRTVHEGIPLPKNKMCSICSRGFNSTMVLKKHILTHTGERPHVCDVCPARFTQKYSLKMHLKSAHGKENG